MSRGNISNVTLTGDVSGTAANPTYGTNIINIGSYLGTGGLVGAPYAAFEKISVSGTHVSGYQYVGGVSGYTNDNTNNDITVGSDVISVDASGEKIYDVFVESTSYYVGGVSGYGTSGSHGMDCNYFKNVTVQNARVTTRASEASGIARVISAEDVTVKDSYIYAASSLAGGVTSSWSTVDRAAVTDSIISAGNYAGGIGGGYVYTYDCTITGSTITAGKYAGGVLGCSYSTTINSTGVVDCTIGSSESLYVGGLLGGCYEGSGIQRYAVIYNSFSKDTTVMALSLIHI